MDHTSYLRRRTIFVVFLGQTLSIIIILCPTSNFLLDVSWKTFPRSPFCTLRTSYMSSITKWLCHDADKISSSYLFNFANACPNIATSSMLKWGHGNYWWRSPTGWWIPSSAGDFYRRWEAFFLSTNGIGCWKIYIIKFNRPRGYLPNNITTRWCLSNSAWIWKFFQGR